MSDTVLEDPATQVRLELVDDELWQGAVGLLGSLAEAWPVLGDDLVEQRLLWLDSVDDRVVGALVDRRRRRAAVSPRL